MGQDCTQAYCKDCDQRVGAERKGINHIFHLLLAVLTVGFWIIILDSVCDQDRRLDLP